ncbi:hypothetical protein D3C85_1894870 [compost metagenome]
MRQQVAERTDGTKQPTSIPIQNSAKDNEDEQAENGNVEQRFAKFLLDFLVVHP